MVGSLRHHSGGSLTVGSAGEEVLNLLEWSPTFMLTTTQEARLMAETHNCNKRYKHSRSYWPKIQFLHFNHHQRGPICHYALKNAFRHSGEVQRSNMWKVNSLFEDQVRGLLVVPLLNRVGINPFYGGCLKREQGRRQLEACNNASGIA